MYEPDAFVHVTPVAAFDIASPPSAPAVDPEPPSPPLPIIKPLLVTVSNPLSELGIVRAGIEVSSDQMYTPLLIVNIIGEPLVQP
jgi:hypothetical protein